jgi:hypothetical protein
LSLSNAGSALDVVWIKIRPDLNRTRASAANTSGAAI